MNAIKANLFLSSFLVVLIIVNINITASNFSTLRNRGKSLSEMHDEIMKLTADRYTSKDAQRDKQELIKMINKKK